MHYNTLNEWMHYNTLYICIWYTRVHAHDSAHTLKHAPEHTQKHIARACVSQNTLYQRVAVWDTRTRTHINLHICRYSQNHSTEHIQTHCAYVRLSKSQKYNITRGVFLWDIHARTHMNLQHMKHMKHTLRLAAQDSRIHSARASVSRQFVMTQCVVVCDVHTRMHIHLRILSKILYRAHTCTLCVRGSLKNTPRCTVYLCEVRAHIRMHMPSKHTITQTREIYTCIYTVSQKISTLDQNTHISTYTYIHPHTHHTHTLEHPTIQYNTHKHITRASVSPGFIVDMCDITPKKKIGFVLSYRFWKRHITSQSTPPTLLGSWFFLCCFLSRIFRRHTIPQIYTRNISFLWSKGSALSLWSNGSATYSSTPPM